MIIDVEQRSADWLQMRIGMLTASRVAEIMARLKPKKKGERGEYSKSRANYCMELVCERLTNWTQDHYVSKYMEWGTEHEPRARSLYEARTEATVFDGGFAIHDTIKWFGASPDFLVGTDGLGEIKCPTAHEHVRTLLACEAPEEYQWQMCAEMECANRAWCDFVSYHPHMPPHLKLFVKRYYRDEAKTAEMLEEARSFLREVESLVLSLPGHMANLEVPTLK